ncbi:hypothetical protein GCM10019016_136710 [Streptomyces prasinosporus]|uniref:Iron chelate uptake ABC transporter family permease subunit n=1 Tax=Streptomyces prasinosporus TaxID=68256 RepID=A0ABP6UFK6_9ACTN
MIVLFSGTAEQVTLGALAGGLLTGLAIYVLAWKRGVHGYRLVLVGIGVSAVVTAVNGYLLTRSDIVDAARAVVWMTGSLDGPGLGPGLAAARPVRRAGAPGPRPLPGPCG